MKRIIVCIVLAAVIFAGGAVSLFYTNSVSDKLLENLDEAERLFESGDSEGAAAAVARASDDWHTFKELHILSMNNDYILEITMSITRLESLVEREDEETVTECAVAKELIMAYRNETMPGIMNIL